MYKKRLSLLLVLMLVLSSFTTSFAGSLKVTDQKSSRLDSAPVRVIVEVEGEYGLNLAKTMRTSVSDLDAESRKAIVKTQEDVMEDLKDTGIDLDVHESYTNILNGFSMTVDERDIDAVKNTEGVKAVYRVNEYKRPEMDYSGEYVNLDEALAYRDGKYDGRGTVVAVIDSGVDYTHKDMKIDYPEHIKLDKTDVTSKIINSGLNGKYFTEKVPYGYNYFDKTNEVIDISEGASMHGMHVAGTVAANGDEDGINGIAPEAQVLAMKVFSNNPNYGSTYGDIIIEAIDESIAMGADVINMSLGATAGTPNSNDLEQMAVQRALDAGIVCAISAGNSSFSGNGALDEGQLPIYAADIGVTGSPSVTPESITVASLENKKLSAQTLTFTDKTDKAHKIFISVGTEEDPADVFENQAIQAVFCGQGGADEFQNINVIDKIALIERGGRTFKEKIDNAMKNGAIAAIIFNHEAGGESLMKMGGVETCEIPAVFMGRSDGLKIKKDGGSVTFTGESVVIDNVTAGEMSDFSSWGTPITLDIKPEITAPGGDILSTFNNNTYGMMSGTSMASPHIAGASASIMQRVRDDFSLSGQKSQEMVKLLMMNTANPKISEGVAHKKFDDFYTDDYKCYNSPRQQGAGILDLYGALETPVTVSEKKSGLGEVNLGEISESKGEVAFDLIFKNHNDSPVTYEIEQQINTAALFDNKIWADAMPVLKASDASETTSYERLTFDVTSDGYDKTSNTITVPADGTLKVSFFVDLDEDQALAADSHEPILDAFENGTFIEGFIRFIDTNDTHADLTMPYLGFYGQWDQLPIIDKTMYPDDTNPGLYEAGLFYDQTDDYLGYTEFSNGYSLNLSDMVIGHVTNASGKKVGSSGIYGNLSLLRNAEQIKYTILDENGKLVETIAHNKDGKRKNYYDAGAGGKTSSLGEGFWDGLINGEPAPNGQYTYRISAKIVGEDADWQHYDYPVFVDNCSAEITGLEQSLGDGGKLESVTIQAKANEIFVRDEKDPSKITSRITVEEGKYKGIRKYGLMELGGSFKVIVSSPDSTLSLKNVPENTSPNSDGSYTLVPFVLSANGALEIGAAFSFTFKDGLPVTDDGGDKILKDVLFENYTVHKDISTVAGKTFEPEFKGAYASTSDGAIVVTKAFAEALYYLDDYDASALTFKKTLDVDDKVTLTIDESFDVAAGKTPLVAVYPISDQMKNKLNSQDAVSEKYLAEIKAYVENNGYKSVKISTDDNLISAITAHPEVASIQSTSGSSITIDIASSPLVAKASVLDGFKEGTDYLKAYTLIVASDDTYTEPSTAVLDDIVPPTVTIDSPEFWSEFTEDSPAIEKETVDGKTVYSVAFSGHVSDESALTDLKLDGVTVESTFNTKTGNWDFEGQVPVEDGKNEFTVLASDKAGNLVEFKQAFFADLIEPVLSIDSNKIQFKRINGKYYVRLNGYVSDTFPVLKLNAGKELIVNESESFAEYSDLLKPLKVELKNTYVPIEKNQESLYIKLVDYGGHVVSERIEIPQHIFKTSSNNHRDDDDDKKDKKKKSSGSSGGGSSKKNNTASSASTSKDDATNISADTFKKENLSKEGRVVIKAPAPSEKNEVKLNLDKKAIQAAHTNKAVLEIDAGIAKLHIDSENLNGASSDSAELSIASVKGSDAVKIQKKQARTESLKPIGDIIDIKLSLDENGEDVHQLKKPVDVEIPLDIDTDSVDTDKLGLFYNNESTGQWEYVGGNYDAASRTLRATLSHFSQYCVMEREIQFTDTDAHWAKSVIEKIASKDIVSGYADGSFNPDGTITHAEFLTLVVKALDFETSYEGDMWYDTYIFASKLNGLIAPEAEFDPEANITREEMAEILGKYLQTKTIEPKYDPIIFIDASEMEDDALQAINTAVSYGLFSGRADGSFDPDATATRAEVSQVIYDLVKVTGSN